MRMILQNVIWSDRACAGQELYYRGEGTAELQGRELSLAAGSAVCTDTYMNLFDRGFWKEYTLASGLELEMEVKGRGRVEVYAGLDAECPASVWEFDTDCFEKKDLPLIQGGEVYFRVVSQGCSIRNGAYVSQVEESAVHPVCIGVVICTYRRSREIQKNIEVLQNTVFFDSHSPVSGKLRVYVVDNASELSRSSCSEISVFHNPNTGGSGGFSRGICECIREREQYGISHVVVMDDDVLFCEETFIRLYALLSTLKKEYQQAVVGGRMFRLDEKHIQSTASEIWNGGNLLHVDSDLDMRERSSLQQLNGEKGEYTGWWFGCFPMTFVKDNLPLPFFLHCDDVEYGLRCGEKPLVLNGVQVWHETADQRKSPLIAYYDIRNAMIVNSLYAPQMPFSSLLLQWMKTVYFYHFHATAEYEYAAVAAMGDYLKGRDHFLAEHEKKEWTGKSANRKKIGVLVAAGVVWCKALFFGKKAWGSFRTLDPQQYSRMILQNTGGEGTR